MLHALVLLLEAPTRVVKQEQQILRWVGSHKDVPNLAPKKSQFGIGNSIAFDVAFDTMYIYFIYMVVMYIICTGCRVVRTQC